MWYLVALRFVVVAGFSASMAFFALYLHGELRVPMETVGALVMLATLTGAPGQILGGAASDRLGRRNLVLVPQLVRGFLFFLMSYLVMAGAHYLYLALALVFVRIFGSFFLAASDAMLADITAPEDRVEGYSLIRVGGNVGWAAGPVLGGLMVQYSYALVFAFTGISALAAVALTWWGLPESLARESRRPLRPRDLHLVWRDRAFATLGIGSALVFVVMGHMVVPLSIYSVEWVGISKIQFGYLCTINGLLVVLLQHPLALLLRRRSPAPLLLGSTLLYGVGYLGMGGADSFAWLAGCLVIVTLAEVVYAPTSLALASRLAPPDSKGRYLGAFGLTRVLGWALAPFVGGLLMGRLPGRPFAVWGAVAALTIAAALVFATGRRSLIERLRTLDKVTPADTLERPLVSAAAGLTGVGPIADGDEGREAPPRDP